MHLTKFIIPGIALFLAFVSFKCKKDEQPRLDDDIVSIISKPYENLLNHSNDPTRIPRSVKDGGTLRTTGIYGWTSGFFAGSLWYLYELTGDPKWKTEAITWTEALDSVQFYGDDHDIGFIINCSYGHGLKVLHNKAYEQVIIQSAKTLSQRYDPIVKSIKSWNYKRSWDRTTEWFFPVIIDNMMNLELLFEATRLSRDSTYYSIAVQHALTTMKNHYRADFSSYHVVNYDPETGKVLDRATNQGFADQSSWARGQAWGLYGFVMCYRYTGDEQFLDFAQQIANYLLSHPNLPEDKIPYWDFNAHDPALTPEWNFDPSKYPVIPRDVSAASITCSALFELSQYSEEQGEYYKKEAKGILSTLLSPEYLANSRGIEYFILDHSVGSIPHDAEVDVPIIYADYYLLEALFRDLHISHNLVPNSFNSVLSQP